MSITVSDVLKLPSMRGARLLAGENGLKRIVSSISVLEYAQINPVQTELLESITFIGNELAITGFMNNPNDVELQCANIRRLAAVGEVGLILFYVGIVMEKVDQRLIDVANELDFALICMPEGQMNQRYSEVICEVMELIHRDQLSSTNLVSALLEQAAGLPVHQRTVDSMLRLLSNRIHASIILLDSSNRVLNEASWPISTIYDAEQIIDWKKDVPRCQWCWNEKANMYVYHDTIQTQESIGMDMHILKAGEALDIVFTRQAVELIQLVVSIWSDRHDSVVIDELVRAILQDEPIKMRRLADIFHVDIASINSMWIVCTDKAEDKPLLESIVAIAREDTEVYSSTAIADIFDNVLVLFMAGPESIQDIRGLTEALLHILETHEIHATITRCHALDTTTRVREAFLSHQASIADTKRVFPNRTVFTLEQIMFVQNCQEIISRGEFAIEETQRCIQVLQKDGVETSLIETLECFMLDADMSVTQTAARLFLHKNTIKYRLQRIADYIGFLPGKFPDSIPLITACALNRLLNEKIDL